MYLQFEWVENACSCGRYVIILHERVMKTWLHKSLLPSFHFIRNILLTLCCHDIVATTALVSLTILTTLSYHQNDKISLNIPVRNCCAGPRLYSFILVLRD